VTAVAADSSLGDPFGSTERATITVTLAARIPPSGPAVVAISHHRCSADSALAGVKSTSYAEHVVAARAARLAGADEALLFNSRNELCEGTHSNVFVVVDDQLYTPPLSSGCLAGITRELVLEWCPATEAVITAEHLRKAKECFLTSSIRDITPVSTIDSRPLPAPGPVTQSVAATWNARVAAELDP